MGRKLLLVLSLVWLTASAHAFDVQPAVATPVEQSACGKVDILFSPWNDIEGAIQRTLRDARQAIYVQAFVFTSRNLARSLVEAHERGIRVEVLADREQTIKAYNSQIPKLVAAGIPVALETRYAAAHNKIILVDPEEAAGVVITGSYNFTYSAQARNAENVVILRGNPAVTRTFLENWKRHQTEALPYVEALKQPSNKGIVKTQ